MAWIGIGHATVTWSVSRYFLDRLITLNNASEKTKKLAVVTYNF